VKLARSCAGAILGGALLLTGAHARADDVEQAKTYFSAGAQAYAAGKFTAAIEAFEEAYRLAPRPAILFSIAQAHRKQYYLEKRADDLRQAIKYYRDYVSKVEQGGRRSDAAQALAELEPLAARLGVESAGAAAPEQPKPQARVMVSSQTKDALVSLDGGSSSEVPLIREVKPGKHRVKVVSPGYFDEEREIVAVEGGLVALDLSLRDKPARLEVSGPSGAAIAIDGRPAGALPQSAQLEVPAGRHLIAITKTGHKPFAQELEFGRGETKKVTAALPVTGQRVAATVAIGAGIVGVGVGAVLAGLSVHEQNKAQTILEQHQSGLITADQHDEYDTARQHRDDLRRFAGVAFGAGAGVGVIGLLLYAFDQPAVGAPPPRSEQTPKTPPRAPTEMPMEVSAVPIWSPGTVGGAVTGRF
jgi:tetratricopeptide (TPR) repeat protein